MRGAGARATSIVVVFVMAVLSPVMAELGVVLPAGGDGVEATAPDGWEPDEGEDGGFEEVADGVCYTMQTNVLVERRLDGV